MRRAILLLFIALLLLTGCGGVQNKEQITDQTRKEENTAPVSAAAVAMEEDINNDEESPTPNAAITEETDGSILIDLSAAASILIKSTSENEGVVLTNATEVNNITGMLSAFKPYSIKEDYEPEYDYTLTFYDTAGMELTTIQAYENFIISYQGEIYYDKMEQFYLWNVRKEYIEEAKTTFSCDTTFFRVNGEVYTMQDLDSSINAITEYSWLGNEELPEPTLILECHINPEVGYCAVFDVEKMDFVFEAYGTAFTYTKDSVTSLIYAFQDSVYNYWGDVLYQNKDDNLYISNLGFASSLDSNVILITLANQQEEKHTEVSCVNYHRIKGIYPEFASNYSDVSEHLAEFRADLTHDGSKEILNLYKTEEGGDLAYLEISDAEGNDMWLEYAHTSHAGWNSVYLCNMNQEDYLLVFNPYQCTGVANYMFALFYLTGQNTIQIADSGYYSFDYGAAEGTTNAFKEETFRTFADKVNTYLKNSYVLMSTEDGLLKYSTKENELSVTDKYETEKWISEIKANLY